ncbi:MAG TPA: 4-hydroxyphenylacetate 3-hydroxylase C-terminal domain-containing protein, partial [Thermodesulfobacteriota bacterium]
MKYSFEYYAPNRKRYQVEGVGEEIIGGVRLDVYLNRPRTLPEILNRTVQRDPKHEAFVYENERLSYGELARRVDSLAFQWKEEYGVRPGDRVMMLLRNTPEFVASFFAASQAEAEIQEFWKKYLASQRFHQGYEIVHDIAGGLISTLPDEREFLDEFSGPYLQKYLKGKEGFSTEDRVRAYRLIEDISVSPRAAQNLAGGLHGGG